MDNRRVHLPLPNLLRRLSNLIGIDRPMSPSRRSLDSADQSDVQLELDLGIDIFGRIRKQPPRDLKR